MDQILFVQGVRHIVAAFFVFQGVSSFGTFILGRVIIDYFEWGIHPKPTNFFQYGQNLFMYGFAGFAVYTYRKAEEEFSNWLTRKAVHLVAFIVLFIVSVVSYYATYGTVKFIFY